MMRMKFNILMFSVSLTLSYFVSSWFLILAFLYAFNYLRLFQIARLSEIRDRADLTTEWGKVLIKGCNKKIDLLNYGVFWKKYR